MFTSVNLIKLDYHNTVQGECFGSGFEERLRGGAALENVQGIGGMSKKYVVIVVCLRKTACAAAERLCSCTKNAAWVRLFVSAR